MTIGVPELKDFKGILSFILQRQIFCINLDDVTTIVNPKELDQDANIFSDKPHILLDVIEVPLIDLRKIFGFDNASGYTDNSRIIVLESNNRFIGFLVDRVADVYSLDKKFLEEYVFTPVKKIYHLSGILDKEPKGMFLINTESLLAEKPD